MQITTIGLDLAKNIFHIIGTDSHGKQVRRRKLRRGQVLAYFAQLPKCLVGMEACASAYYWAREIQTLGHTVKLIPPQHVKPYVDGQKNDYNDAAGIAEAVTRPKIQKKCVAIKTVEQQDQQAIYRFYQGALDSRTRLCNKTRGLLAEYGIILPKGIKVLRSAIPEILENADNGLSGFFREHLAVMSEQLQALDKQITSHKEAILLTAKTDEVCQRLQALPGFGPLVSLAFKAHVGDGHQFQRGRDNSASIGVVPKQHSSGGKEVLLGITKQGNKQLRCLLVHGARSVVSAAKKKKDPLSLWINRIREKRGYNKATVALVNKMARVGWAIIRYGETYQPGKRIKH